MWGPRRKPGWFRIRSGVAIHDGHIQARAIAEVSTARPDVEADTVTMNHAGLYGSARRHRSPATSSRRVARRSVMLKWELVLQHGPREGRAIFRNANLCDSFISISSDIP